MSASFVLPLVLVEVATVVLGVKNVITLHVAVGLVLIGPLLVKLASVTYRMLSYYRGASEYRQRDKPSDGLRLLGGALAIAIVSVLLSGIALIVGPSGLHSVARSVHVATAYLTVALMIVHVAIHVPKALGLASADARPHAPIVPGGRSRWLVLAASLALSGVLALLLGGRGASYLRHYYPGYLSRATVMFTHQPVADRGEPSRHATRHSPLTGRGPSSAAAHAGLIPPVRPWRLTMANLAREGDEIVVKLSVGERILGIHRDGQVPLSAHWPAASSEPLGGRYVPATALPRHLKRLPIPNPRKDSHGHHHNRRAHHERCDRRLRQALVA